jgi:DEAD/DEAH box helicase domain-containing protein
VSESLSYGRLLHELRRRSSRAHASLLAPASAPLRSWIEASLGSPPGSDDGLLAQPVFEHKFGFKRDDRTLADLEAAGLLTTTLVNNMDSPPSSHIEQAFPRTRRPYTHQVASWSALRAKEPKSVVVSAGTGSGKTECFLVPILDDLARQSARTSAPLEGVQAILLYPLNALINSQRERLSAWTKGFGGRVRYCLYNGETSKTAVPKSTQDANLERVMSRPLLRKSPPPLLITNATMLEYMLVRPEDRDILAKSQKRLRYVVIDEAHTYVGSAAAELALLIRRVMNAFDVDPASVRFVATSATLSTGDLTAASADIRRFLADIAGQPEDRITVVTDSRDIPALPQRGITADWPESLVTGSPEARFDSLIQSRGPQLIRRLLTNEGAQTVEVIANALADDQINISTEELIQFFDHAKDARPSGLNSDGEPFDPFLPIRGHFHVRGLPGLWACLNPTCSGRASSALRDAAWAFGRTFTSRHTSCRDCGGRVYEIALCQGCGLELLMGRYVIGADGFENLDPVSFDEITAPPDDAAEPDPADDSGEGEIESDDAVHVSRADIRLVTRPGIAPASPTVQTVAFDPTSGAIDDGEAKFCVVRGETFECPRCSHRDRSHQELFFRSCMTGRNFLLGVTVPVLLGHMREGEAHLPFDGRRTISFTDSRQGTARFAARSQGESERNYIRTFIYHQVLSAQEQAPTKVAEARQELVALRAAAAALPGQLDILVRKKENEVAGLEVGIRVPLRDVASRLAGAGNFKHLLQYWRDYLPFKEAEISDEQLARWMVLREFARRPLRRASMETMGLVSVHYPGLELTRAPPRLWQRWAGDAAFSSWHDFLKLCLDYYVRANSAVQLDARFFRWLGTEIRPRIATGPGRKPIRGQATWPQFGDGRSRLARIIVRAFKLNHQDPQAQADIDEVLTAAWDYASPALRGTEGGRHLALEDMELALITNAWLCPMTRMMLDTTLLGHTPYQPPLTSRFDTLAQSVRMPRPPLAFGPNLVAWFDNDPDVDLARAAGALSEFTERTLVGSPYFQVAEHSAQLSGTALRKAEAQFKEGRLNLLSCSTTMEMGVDIGGLTGVAMNNVPPSPANFLQRVGRAGRRGETGAVSLTVCRHLPHDQAVYAHPDWPFRTPTHVTGVRLDSERIVSRHVQASVLSRYLLTEAQPETILRLGCAWFFLPPEGQIESVCDRLVAWLLSDATLDKRLASDLERLTRGTVLAGTSAQQLLADSAPAFSRASRVFGEIRASLISQREALPLEQREDSPPAWAIKRQLERLDRDYLLGYLASQQVLPGYGFPTGVLPLVTTTVEELSALRTADKRAKERRAAGDPETRDEREEREDTRTRLTGFPSRDLPVALREYAPGSNVILERRTYVPMGVTLHWHLPPEAGESSVRDVQALRWAWQCHRCGRSGTAPGAPPEACPACGREELEKRRYLEPTGFAVNLFTRAQMDAAPPVYMPYEDPWISSGDGPFDSLGSPTLVRARHAPEGDIVHMSRGLHGYGYALCLRCGRAEPEVAGPIGGLVGDLPGGMKDHYRLRGGKGSNWKPDGEKGSSPCEGNEAHWAIQRHLALGGTQRTDVLELHFIHPKTGHLIADRVLLTTLAAALRKEATRGIGVDARELGFQVASRTVDEQHGLAVLLYDTAAGGAGFCGEVLRFLPKFLDSAVATCRCPRGCDGACHSCLLSNDTQHDLGDIDRFRLAPVEGEPLIGGASWLVALAPKPSDQIFGAKTAFVWGHPALAVLRQARRMSGSGGKLDVRLYAQGDELEPALWSGRALVRGLQALGNVAITLVLPQSSLPTEWHTARQLAGLLESEEIALRVVPNPNDSGPMSVWAELVNDHGGYAFAARGDDLGLHAEWACKQIDALHVEGAAVPRVHAGVTRSPESLLVAPASPVAVADLRPSVAGRAHEFGARFWTTLEAAAPGFLGDQPFERVTYQDRYLQSPGSVHGLFSALSQLKARHLLTASTQVEVVALASAIGRAPRNFGDNWPSREAQRAALEGVLGALGCPFILTLIDDRDRQKIQHFRSLELMSKGREVEVRLDQGFGFLRAPQERFPFELSAQQQISRLLGGSWVWEPPRLRVDLPAYVLGM